MDQQQQEAEARKLTAEATQKLVDLARRFEVIMSPDQVASAFAYALTIYLKGRSSEADAIAFLRSLADDLEASPEAPRTVN